MINTSKKINILLSDLFCQLSYRLSINKKPLIIWGRSPFLDFGPGIRTRRFKRFIEKETINKICIYMQSHWPWYEIILYIVFAKLLNIKIIFNQNGIYTKKYNKNYIFHNLILIFGILNSNYTIYQSWYCYKSIIKITPDLLKNLIRSKRYKRILNPTIDNEEYVFSSNLKKHKILICNHKNNSFYSKYIYELSKKLLDQKSIKEINIVGNIKENINEEKLRKLLNTKNISLFGKLDNKLLLEIIEKNTIVIHLNYGDPCPNFISEVISYGLPCILNDIGGGKEIAQKACLCPKNKIYLEGYHMPKINDVIQSLNKLISNYKSHQIYAIKRAHQLNIKNYVQLHLNIINKI